MEKPIIDSSDAEHQLLQSKEIADNVKNLETPLEGILLKSDEIAKNTKPKDVQKIEIQGAEVVTIKGDKGEKGDTGSEPADERLKELIIPLIPDPIKGDDGKTPTEEEVLALLKPFIPDPIKGDKGEKGDDGISPDETAIVKKVVSLIPKSQSGKPGKDGSPDTPEQIKAKLLKAGFNYEELKGLPDIAKMVRIYSSKSSKTVSLEELDDVDTSVLNKINNKYPLQNQIIVSATAPTDPYLNQLWYDIS